MSLPMRWEPEPQPETIQTPHTPLRRRRASRPVHRVQNALLLTLALLLLALAGVGAQTLWKQARTTELTLVASRTAPGQVKLVAATIERQVGFVTVTGSAINLSARSLANVEVVAELLDARSRPVSLERALVVAPTLTPNADSPFRVVLTDHPGAARVRVRFAELAGATLN